MSGAAVGDAMMQMANELEIAQRVNDTLCRESLALQERIFSLERENMRLKLFNLKKQIQVTETA